MFEKLKALKDQYEQLCARLELPETYSDASAYARYEREARELAPVVEAYTAYDERRDRPWKRPWSSWPMRR